MLWAVLFASTFGHNILARYHSICRCTYRHAVAFPIVCCMRAHVKIAAQVQKSKGATCAKTMSCSHFSSLPNAWKRQNISLTDYHRSSHRDTYRIGSQAESMLNVRRHRIPGYRNARHSMCNKSISLRASPRLNLRHSARASTYPQSLRCHAPAGGSCVTTAVIKFSLNTGSHAGGSGSSRQVWSLVHCARLYALELGRSCDTTLQHTARVRSASTSLDGMPSDNLDEHAIDNESSMQLLSYHTTQQTPFDQASTFVPPASCR